MKYDLRPPTFPMCLVSKSMLNNDLIYIDSKVIFIVEISYTGQTD